MPKGQPLSKAIKLLIFSHHCLAGEDYNSIFKNVFCSDTSTISLFSIRRLCEQLDDKKDDDDGILNILECSSCSPTNRVAGRKRRFTDIESDHIVSLVENNCSLRLHELATIFVDTFYGDNDVTIPPCMSTIYRELIKRGFSYKEVVYRNLLANPIEQLQYLQDIAFLDPSLIVDIDGMVQNPKDFKTKFGWSPVGNEASKYQIKIGNITYAVLCAYTQYGFLAYEIFIGNVTQIEVVEFIELKVKPLLSENSFGILDNAANFHTATVHQSLEETFNGRYRYCAAYSPHLKPVELGISNVKNYTQAHERLDMEPLALLRLAFDTYSIGGDSGDAAYNHWKGYRENHREYLEDNIGN